MLYLLAPAGSRYRIGRSEVLPAPGCVALLPAQLDFTRESPAGCFLAVRIDQAALQAECAAREPRHGLHTLHAPRLVELRPGAPTLARLVDATRAVLEAADADAAAATAAPAKAAAAAGAAAPLAGAGPCRLDLAEARLVARVTDLLTQQALPSHRERAGEITAARLAALEAWIEAHLAEPLTLGALCAQAGVGARSLQKAFQARRGMSPVRYVLERRLARAQARLSHALPGDTVTMVALDCGFDHMSRFAQSYRRLFGEAPSQTLARSLGAGWGHGARHRAVGLALAAQGPARLAGAAGSAPPR
jgi:AraC-like DNA-binding protein